MSAKKILTIILIIFVIGSIVYTMAFKAKTIGSANEPLKINLQGDKIIVYYFYTDVRCATCINIENYTKQAVESFGINTIEFCGINTDIEDNQHFVSDYKLYSKAVVVSKIQDGKELKWQNLEKIWELAGDKEKFVEYITENVRLIMSGNNE